MSSPHIDHDVENLLLKATTHLLRSSGDLLRTTSTISVHPDTKWIEMPHDHQGRIRSLPSSRPSSRLPSRAASPSREFNEDIDEWLHPLLLCTAAAKGDVEKLRHMIEKKGFDPSDADYDGRSALHLACEEGHLEAVKYLVSSGADINRQDRWGSSPMRGALFFNRGEIARFLKDHGATLGYTNKFGSGGAAVKSAQKDEELQALFTALDSRTYSTPPNSVPIEAINRFLKEQGISVKRHKVVQQQLKLLDQASGGNGVLKFAEFKRVMADDETLLARAFSDRLVIPNWKSFCKEVGEIFESCRNITGGKLADYIPELAEVDPELWGMSIMTVDGQCVHFGDDKADFSVQSGGKPCLYAFTAEDIGLERLHEYVGREPSGVAFNAFTLNSEKKPHNPFINSGAIMTSALFYSDLVLSKRFKMLTEKFRQLAGGEKIGFNQSVYLSEKSVAHRNYALAHFMMSEGGFPPHVDILDTVDFYFQMCSCEANCNSMASIAASFANNGKSPIADKKMLSSPIVKNTLQLMYSCGMYDFSGEWACTVGLPAKSGVSGCIWACIPDVMGIAIYSPRLDDHGNSVRGIEFYKRLVEKFRWNLFDILYAKLDVREIQHYATQNVPTSPSWNPEDHAIPYHMVKRA
jgi:glutaminase